MAHVVEGTTCPLPDEKGNIEEAWAVHQMCTTANFARNSRIAKLPLRRSEYADRTPFVPPNMPCVLPYRDIVQKTAQEFNLPYIENETFLLALQSHYRMLRKLGVEEW